MSVDKKQQEKCQESPKSGSDEPFLDGSPRAQFLAEDDVKDKGNVVLMIMMLHGLGTLIAWNIFITIAPMYYQGYKLKDPDAETQPAYVNNFMNFVCIVSQLPNLLVNMISMFSSGGNLVQRIVVCLCLATSCCFVTVVFVFIDTSAWRFGFFIFTMISVVVLNSANGFYQNSVYGLVGSFPGKYINAVVLGNNLCGLFVTVLCMLTTFFITDPQLNAAVYFSIALILLVICIASFIYVRKNEYFLHQMAVARRSAEAHGTLAFSDFFQVFCSYWPRLINVSCVFFVSLLLFPSVLLDIRLFPNHRAYDLFIPQNLYASIVIFLNFNLFAVIGSKMADYVQWPSPKYAWAPIWSRLLFIPIFFFCNYVPSGYRTWAVLIPNEWAVFVLISLMSLSHGYYTSISLMYAPRDVDANTARLLGKMSAFFLVLGIATGITCSFFTNYLVHL